MTAEAGHGAAMPVTGTPPAPVLGTAGNPRPGESVALMVSLAVAYGVAGLGGMSASDAIPGWYRMLTKPPLNPPDWVFAPVWTALYTAMAVAAWLAWRTRRSSCRKRGLRLYAVQLLLNLSWTWIFFGAHRPGAAVVEVALLWVAIGLTMQAFWRMSRLGAWLLAPYLAWVSFAGYLNWGIWRLNR